MDDRGESDCKVLIVDDDPAARNGYAAYLTDRGYHVVTAATGREAVMWATQWIPSVIVLDLGLPDIDGWEVARQLKAQPATTGVPIIALTGAILAHERVSAMRAGCDRHLAKPCAPTDLLDAIDRCFRAGT
jgi:CheY-like chemotaxis protein